MIRHGLRMGSHQPFVRCPKKIKGLAKKLDRQMGFSEREIYSTKHGHHSKQYHVCAECGCKKPAGSGTYGWWYWPSPEGRLSWSKIQPITMFGDDGKLGEVGHYGVGPCWRHGQGMITELGTGRGIGPHYEESVKNDIMAMQLTGAAPDDGGRWAVELKEHGKLATIKQDAAKATDILRTQLDAMLEQLQDPERTFTEKMGKGAGEITDKSKVEVIAKLARGLSDLTKNEFLLDQGSYVHRTEMELLMSRIITTCERFVNPTEWRDFMQEIKEATMNVRRGKAK